MYLLSRKNFLFLKGIALAANTEFLKKCFPILLIVSDRNSDGKYVLLDKLPYKLGKNTSP